MEFRVLGPLEVVAEGEAVPLGGGKQRALLALLLLRPNEPVSVDRIVDELWGERAPATAAKNVQVYVSHLRKVLGDDVIVTRPPGYAVRVGDGELDAERAERTLADAAGRPPAERRELLAAALAAWRGPPLADLADEPFAQAEIGRLEELRLQLLSRRLEAELELGRHGEILVELERLVAAHPLDERLRAQLMLALYRSGRQADALGVYRDTRRVLSQELGLEPDEELRSLEQRILAHDPSLQAPPRPEPSVADRPRRLPRTLLLGAALALAAALLALVLALARDDSPAALAVGANSIAVIDPERDAVVASIPVGRQPETVVAGTGLVWVANVGDRTLSRIDTDTLAVKTIGLGFEPTDLAADGDQVWVVGGFDHVLWRVDRDGTPRLKLRFTERLGPLPEGFERGRAGVAVGVGAVWLSHGDEVTEVDPVTGAVLRTVRAGGRWHREIAAGGGQVWVGVNDSSPRPEGAERVRGLDVIDADTGRVTKLSTVYETSEILYASDRLWSALWLAASIWQYDPAGNFLLRTIPAGYEPEGLAFLDEALWVTNERDGQVRRIDAASGETEQVLELGNLLEGIAAADGRIWVAVR